MVRQELHDAGSQNAVHARRQICLEHVGLDQLDVPPAVPLDALPRFGQHGRCQVETEDPPIRADGLLEEGEVQTRTTAQFEHGIAWPEIECLHRPRAC